MKSVLITFDQAYYERNHRFTRPARVVGASLIRKHLQGAVRRPVIRISAATPGLQYVLRPF